MAKPKRARLFFDIETSPNVVFSWSTGYDLNISEENIIHERAIICIGYKWSDEAEVHCLTWDKNQNDKAMLNKFIPIMNIADEVVGHNGDKFDLPWVRTRCIKHGIGMMPRYTSIDTLKEARSNFNFNSNKLDYISKYLGTGAKYQTGFKLWKDIVLNKDAKALKQMALYCKNDVLLLERVYNKMKNYLPAKTNIANVISSCPECGSDKTAINQRKVTAAGYKHVTFRCKDCGKYHTVAESRFNKGKAI